MKIGDPLSRFPDPVSLIRCALEQNPVFEPFDKHVHLRSTTLLEEMRDYFNTRGSVDRSHLKADNVLGPVWMAFGERLWPFMDVLNLTLAGEEADQAESDRKGSICRIWWLDRRHRRTA